MLRYCANLKAIRYESTSLNRIVADKSHRVIAALSITCARFRRIRICTVQVSKAKWWSHVKTKLLRKNYRLKLPVTLMLWRLMPGFHIVVTGRWVSLTVFRGHWSIWVVGNHCQSLAVFQCRWQSFMVVNGLSKLSLKCILLAPNLLSFLDGLSGSLAVAKGILFCFHITQMKRQGRWWSFRVVNGRWDIYPGGGGRSTSTSFVRGCVATWLEN